MEGKASDKGNLINLTPEEIAGLKAEALRGRPYANRVSLALALRLLHHADPYFEPRDVLTELDWLETDVSRSGTKPASPFQSTGPLAGFWHKHFFSARHLLKNIAVRWNIDGGGNKAFMLMINEVALEHGQRPTRWHRALAHRLTVEAFEERATARRLTGDWIIFARHCGTNYYLDLATHEEAKKYGDERLLLKLRAGSSAEFPFLFHNIAGE